MDGSNERQTWRPLLEGPDAERAREAVADVTAELDPARREDMGPSLASGSAGVAVFYSYMNEAEPEAGHDDTAMACLDAAIQAVAEQELMPHYYAGFPGVAWAVEHLRGRLFEMDEGDEDPNEEIDQAVRDRLSLSPWRADYDLIVGLVGLGVYALERLPRPAAAENIGRVLDRLEEIAVHLPEGTTWFTPPELLWEGARVYAPEGYYNLGVAHGVPGVIAWLAEVVASGVEAERARALLGSAVPWLLAQRHDGSAGFVFSSSVVAGKPPAGSRLAWCYGDPGVATALFLAGRLAGEPTWERDALEIARIAIRRTIEESGVNDPGLCHGSAGLGLLFNRLWQASGDEEMAEAARFWFRYTLDNRRPGEGIGGFQAWEPERLGDDFQWLTRPGLLTGSAGIGLALLSATTDLEPAWDRFLLTSIPPGTNPRRQ